MFKMLQLQKRKGSFLPAFFKQKEKKEEERY